MSLNVLYVDDQRGFLDLMELSTEEMDVEVHTTKDPQEAYEMFVGDEIDYDAIISDYDMGYWNGEELLDEVRGHDDQVPFFFHTSRTKSEIGVDDFDQCVTEYMEKASVPDEYRQLAEQVMSCSDF
jgi:DNA-binding NtrC family response regulator